MQVVKIFTIDQTYLVCTLLLLPALSTMKQEQHFHYQIGHKRVSSGYQCLQVMAC